MNAPDGWKMIVNSQNKEALQKNFKFNDFKEAFAFMTQVALKAEELQHHPEWFNVYNQVNVELTTHDSGGISSKDIEMADYINSIQTKV